jgi:hypothetical protein
MRLKSREEVESDLGEFHVVELTKLMMAVRRFIMNQTFKYMTINAQKDMLVCIVCVKLMSPLENNLCGLHFAVFKSPITCRRRLR